MSEKVETTSVTELVDYTKDPVYLVEQIKTYLRCKCAELNMKPSEFATVFDIDETLLYFIESGGGGELALQPVGRTLYTHCRDEGFEIDFITARVGEKASLKYVQDQLKILGYTYKALFMVSKEHESDDCPSVCKLRSRLDIGKPVIMNCGNRCSDLFATDHAMDPVLASVNPRTFYVFKGMAPDLLCVKLPTDCPRFSEDEEGEEEEEDE